MIGLLFLFGVLLLTENYTKYRYEILMDLCMSISTLIRPINYFLIFLILIRLICYSFYIKLLRKRIEIITLEGVNFTKHDSSWWVAN